MDLEPVKTWAALASPVLAMLGLGWAFVSWRRAGSRLRVHALLYREVLVLWIFNAGRTTDQVERVVLGGRRGGLGGFELTDLIEAPISLAPGVSARRELPWTELVPEDRHRLLSAGWESAWLLLGSMQQRRVEVMAIPERRPPTVGWRLAPRSANVTRYLPIAGVLPLALVTAASPTHAGYGAAALVLLWVVVIVRLTLAQQREPARRRVERWAFACLALVALVIWLYRADARSGGWAPWVNYSFMTAGALLAFPGAVSTVYLAVTAVVARLKGALQADGL